MSKCNFVYSSLAPPIDPGSPTLIDLILVDARKPLFFGEGTVLRQVDTVSQLSSSKQLMWIQLVYFCQYIILCNYLRQQVV